MQASEGRHRKERSEREDGESLEGDDCRFQAVDSTAVCLPRHIGKAAAASDFARDCESYKENKMGGSEVRVGGKQGDEL